MHLIGCKRLDLSQFVDWNYVPKPEKGTLAIRYKR